MKVIKMMEIPCELSFSSTCNIFEAINMVAMEFDQDNKSRSLLDTGHSLSVLTCG